MAWCSRLLPTTASAFAKAFTRTVSVSASKFGADYSHHSPDYYAVLGVSRAAKLPEIKLAYFRQAKKFHPDTNPGDEARWMFELAAEAYDVLSSDEKRKVRTRTDVYEISDRMVIFGSLLPLIFINYIIIL